MYKLIAVLAASILVSLSAFAYASDGAAANVRTGHIGDTLRLRGSDVTYNTADVTVLRTRREPAKGRFGVRIALKNVRTQYNKYMDWRDDIANCVKLVDTRGRRMRPLASSTLIDSGGLGICTIHLDLGKSMRGWVYFKMKAGQKAKTFQFRVNGRLGYDRGRWSLR